MQPNERRTRLQSATLARGKMFLKSEWGWLPGFPNQTKPACVVWVALPRESQQGQQRIELDRESLHRATYTRTKLIRRFPRVLPRLVEDVVWWKQGTANILDWLNESIHRDRPLPTSLMEQENAFRPHAIKLARALVAQRPDRQPILDALTWVTYLTPADFLAGVKWLRDNEGAINVLCSRVDPDDRVVSPLILWELSRRVGIRRTQPLVAWLGQSHTHICATSATQFKDESRRVINRLRNGCRPAKAIDEVRSLLDIERPAIAGKSLWSFVNWLLEKDRATACRAMDLLRALFPLEIYDRWNTWWLKWADFSRWFSKHQCEPHRFDSDSACCLLEGLFQSTPPSLHPKPIIEAIQAASVPVRRKFHSLLLRSVGTLPMNGFGSFMRAAFLVHWVGLEDSHGSKVSPFIREFTRYQDTSLEPALLYSPWREVLTAWERGCGLAWAGPSDDLLTDLETQSQWRNVLATLARCVAASAEPIDPEGVEWAIVLATHSRSVDEAFDHYIAVGFTESRTSYPSENRVKLASRLAENSKDFAALYTRLDKSNVLDWDDHERLLELHEQLRAKGWGGLLRAVIGDRQLQQAVSLLSLTKICAEVAQSILPPAAPIVLKDPPWAEAYPRAVQKPLAMLNAVTPDAQAKARRALKSLFFEPERIDAEIQAIEKLLAAQPSDDRLATRLEHLRDRRKGPRPPKPAQIRKAVERIDRLTHIVVLNTWRRSLESKLREALPGYLKTTGETSVLLENRHLAAFAAALELTGRSKALAVALYGRRCDPAPWDMNSHPANESFVRRMTERGLSLSPWLEHRNPDIWIARNGAQLTVGFEEDPLEIFQMGACFNTCLSPGDCNFFSVFAIAADANKKVLFARDSQGRVVGRCLFAISEAGGILTFHPYCHDDRIGFADCVNEAASRIAKEIGTVAVARGTVATLVADEWYDDGPVDLCGRFPCLGDGSESRKALLTTPLSDLRHLITSAFQPLPLNSLTLSMLLDLPEFETRPELVIPLLSDLERVEGLTTGQWRRVLECTAEVGARSFAIKLIQRRIVDVVGSEFGRNDWVDVRLLEAIAKNDASTAIRLLRMTRPRGIRRDDDDDDDRKQVLATALRRLGRGKKAERLLSPQRDSSRH